MKTIIRFLLLYFSLFITSCTLFQPYLVLILQIPPLPISWQGTFNDLSYLVCYPDESGCLVYDYARPDQPVFQVPLSKKYNSFVVIYPLINGGEICLLPAGAIYPLHLKTGSEDTLILTWEAGFVAKIFKRLWEKHIDLSSFNTARLIAELREKSPADPWQLDENLIVEHLAAYDFTVYDIKKLPVRDITLTVPPGSWFLESPFSDFYVAEEDGQLNLPGVSLGFHRLFQYQEGTRLDLYLTENECIVVSP